MIFSEETLRYPAACYCPSTLIHTVQHDIYRGNTKISSIILLSFYIKIYLYNMILSEEKQISSSMLLSFYINTYLYNMILAEETLSYSAAC
jgi:hypothetical protein